MGYICKECGNQETFKATQQITQWCTQTVILTNEGEVNDWLETTVNDDEVTDGPDNEECTNCGSSDIVWEEDEEVIEDILKEVETNKEPSKVESWKEELK